MRYAERLKARQEQEREHKLKSKRLVRRQKRNAGLPATCYLCKTETTYAEIFMVEYVGRMHPRSIHNRCEPCLTKEVERLSPEGPRYPGEDIFWRLS